MPAQLWIQFTKTHEGAVCFKDQIFPKCICKYDVFLKSYIDSKYSPSDGISSQMMAPILK